MVGVSVFDDKLLQYDTGMTIGDLASVTITLRDREGNYIAEDLPASRLVDGFGTLLRGLVFDPVYIDWRRSFARPTVVLAKRLCLAAIYENAGFDADPNTPRRQA